MKKINIKNIFFFVIIFIIILLTTTSKPLNDLDELWNYNIANNIAKGLVPYRDISMITSPLLAMITAIFLKLIANELIITRILTAVLGTLILYSLYRTMKLLKFNDEVNLLIIVILLMNLLKFFCLDYNWFIALITINILNLELKNIQKKEENIEYNNFKYEFFIGVLTGISICCKQSVGILIATASILNNIIFIKSKNDFKLFLKNSLFRILGIIAPILILVLYLQYNNALEDFIDYCILGIRTFSNSIPYTILIKDKNIFIKVTSILIPLTYIITSLLIIYNLLKKGTIFKNIFTMLIYGVALFIIAFPISNDIHFLIGSLISMILMSYIIYNIFLKYVTKKYNKIIKFIILFIYCFLILYLLVASIKTFNVMFKKYKITNDIPHYKYIPISESLIESIHNIDNFILNSEQKVYILDSDTAIYTIPIDIYNKDYDMFNIGNLGGRGEEGKIEDLQKEKNIIILIKKDGIPRNWQTPELVREYIVSNFNKIGNIENYDIYLKE